MSLVKAKLIEKDILDFSSGKISKRYVRQALRQIEVLASNNHGITLIHNWITVGMYMIHIVPPFTAHLSRGEKTYLKEYGGFGIDIAERGPNRIIVDFSKDSRFRNQSWVAEANNYSLHIKDLTDVILYCSRLDKLRAFN